METSLVSQIQTAIGESLSNVNISESGVEQTFNQTAEKTGEEKFLEQLKFWKEIFHMQDSFNKIVYPNWKNEGFNWTRAIRGEIFETIDSFNWEWWKKKKNTPDYVNAEIELVDTLHFLISHCIKDSNTPESINNMATTIYTLGISKYNQLKEPRTFDQELFIKTGEELIRDSITNTAHYQLMVIKFFDMWFMLNSKNDIDLLIRLYRAKNTLNAFRQAHGYKEGTYLKIWGEEEDNLVCWKIAKTLELSDEFHTQLTNKLEESYKLFSN